MELPEYVTKPHIGAYFIQDILNAFSLVFAFTVFFMMMLASFQIKDSRILILGSLLFFVVVLLDLFLIYLNKINEIYHIYKDRIEHHHKRGVNTVTLDEIEGVEYKRHLGDRIYNTHTLNLGKIRLKHLSDYGHVHYLIQNLKAEAQ